MSPTYPTDTLLYCNRATYHSVVVVELIVEHGEVRVREQIQLAFSCGLGATVHSTDKATNGQVICRVAYISLVAVVGG
jgi:hypothetical protein